MKDEEELMGTNWKRDLLPDWGQMFVNHIKTAEHGYLLNPGNWLC